MAAQRAMQHGSEGQDANVLISAVENVFRNLARLLVGRMTFSRLQQIFREIFVQEAEAKLRRERPGKNVPLSQLALLTGLDTRTLIRIRGDISSRQALGEQQRAKISDVSSEAKVVEMWALNPRYRDQASGHPRVLSYGEPGSEFEQLVKQVVTARGVTVQSIMERLLATNTVELNRDRGLLTLLTERFTPFHSQDEMSLMANGLAAISNLSGTVCQNVQAPQDGRVIQRELWTFRLDEDRREEFRTKVRKFLLDVENRAEKVMAPMESKFEYDDQVTAGLGFYYFEEE